MLLGEILSFAIFIFLPLILVGGAVALLTLIPPVRRLARSNARARDLAVLAVGLVCLGLSLAYYLRLGAEITYIFGVPKMVLETGEVGELAEYSDNKRAIIRELGVRRLVPPPLRQACQTGRELICQLADSVESPSMRETSGWQDYLTGWAVSCIAALSGSGFAWLFTRRRTKTT